MKVVFVKEPLSRLLRWTRWILTACAVSMLGYCGFVLADSWAFQSAERREFDRSLENSSVSPASLQTAPPATAGGLIGRMEIERLGVSVMVLEGTKASTLRRAVGHIRGTALPGQPGNSGIAGHRDTFFRPLRKIRENDIITLTTLFGQYRYRVLSARVVDPAEVSVLEATGNEILTLVTCYPFYFVGSAPDRFVVRAERVT